MKREAQYVGSTGDNVRLLRNANAPLGVIIENNKEDPYSELSKDTKFSLRTLLSVSAFIIAVFAFHIEVSFLGIGKDNDLRSLAWLSSLFLSFHFLTALLYYVRDLRKSFINKRDADIRLLEFINDEKELTTNPRLKGKSDTEVNLKYVQNRIRELENVNFNHNLIIIFLNGLLPVIIAIVSAVFLYLYLSTVPIQEPATVSSLNEAVASQKLKSGQKTKH
ncbi:MAG: hypothetical protein ACTSXQ_05715 [Alphaproteobacteria bacterium]